jgi:anti-sigma factor RsiW
MTLPDTIEQQQMLIMDYLYGEMSAAQRLDFETALTQNSAFNRLYEAELKLKAIGGC